jgi:FMN phosphatase YigB (HAD superfamily)
VEEAQDFEDFDRRYMLYWMRTSLELVNEFLKEEYDQQSSEDHVAEGKDKEPRAPLVQLVLPETEAEQIKIARDAHMYCTALVQADYPGVVEAILKLKFEQNFDMYTCSGESAPELELTFRTLGISTLAAAETARKELHNGSEAARLLQPVFTKLYGPDLINCNKSSSRFYELIFQDSGVDPKDAVILDDKEYILGWVKVHGARTVLISDKDRTGKELMVEVKEKGENGMVEIKKVPAVDHQLTSLTELPELTEKWRIHLARTNGAKSA